MKQTAVEWVKPQIELMLMDGHKSYPNELEEVFEIAKEMEKQQQGYSEEDLKEAFSMGRLNKNIKDFNQRFKKK